MSKASEGRILNLWAMLEENHLLIKYLTWILIGMNFFLVFEALTVFSDVAFCSK